MKQCEYLTPNCCDKAKTSKSVRLGLYPPGTEFGQWKDVKPKWYIVGDSFDKAFSKHWSTEVEIDKCPFCGSVLPDVEINNEIENITEGDEEYCDTCGERNMCCQCFPPEYRWKIKNT